MISILKSAVPALFIFVAAFAAGFAQERLAVAPLEIVTAAGPAHRFTVEIAVTPRERAHGLMNRTDLAADQGMLFDFGESRDVQMWMKDTPLPLDMLFIDSAGRISRIAERTVPFSEAIIGSQAPVRYVLELNGGRAAALGIRAGDRVTIAGQPLGRP